MAPRVARSAIHHGAFPCVLRWIVAASTPASLLATTSMLTRISFGVGPSDVHGSAFIGPWRITATPTPASLLTTMSMVAQIPSKVPF
jgi:hypothetical protein